MAPSTSKQKRLAEKAAKKASGTNEATPSSTTGSAYGGSTPLTTLSRGGSKAASQEDLMSMARLNIATDRLI